MSRVKLCPDCREAWEVPNNHKCQLSGRTYYGWPATVALPGSISHGTLNPDHLIPTFESTLRAVWPEEYATLRAWYDGQPGDSEDADEYLIKLQDALDEAAPESYRFGTLEGDGSDFGFWEDETYPSDELDDEGGQPQALQPPDQAVVYIDTDGHFEATSMFPPNVSADEYAQRLGESGLPAIVISRRWLIVQAQLQAATR